MARQYQLLEGEPVSTHVGDNKDYVDVRTATSDFLEFKILCGGMLSE